MKQILKKGILLLAAGLLLASGAFCAPQPKVQIIKPPPIPKEPPKAKDYFQTILRCSKSEAWFKMPVECDAYSIMTVEYTLKGGDPYAAVEANAFEDTEKSVYLSAANSALPSGLKLRIQYKGSVISEGLGYQTDTSNPALRRFFSSHSSYWHFFQVANNGDAVLKSQGLGMVSYRIKIINSEGKLIDWGGHYTQLADKDLYPGDTATFACLLDPLPAGKYELHLTAHLHNTEAFDSWDAGAIVAETVFPIEVTEEANPNSGFAVPDYEETLRPPLFPRDIYHWEEYLQVFQVHALDTSTIKGTLNLRVPGDTRFFTIKLVTPYGVTNAGWRIKINPPAIKKEEKKELKKNKELWVDYRPEITARFFPDAPQHIKKDIKEIKNNHATGVILPVYLLASDTEALPLQLALNACKKEGLKVIPILYSDKYHDALMQYYAKDSAKKEKENNNPEEEAFKKLVNDFEREWGSTLYSHDGKAWALFRDFPEYSVEYGRHQEAFLADDSGFQAWVKNKYEDTYKVNLEWGSDYRDFSQMKPLEAYGNDTLRSAVYKEGTPGGKELDLYRSWRNASQIKELSEWAGKEIPSLKSGISSEAIYGIESTERNNYYSLSTENWIAARAGLLTDYLLNKDTSGLGFILYRDIEPDIDTHKAVQSLNGKGIQPVVLHQFNGIRFFPYAPLPDIWVQRGGWWKRENAQCRDYRARKSLFKGLLEANLSGAIPGIYSWNDYSQFCRMTDIQLKEIKSYWDVME